MAYKIKNVLDFEWSEEFISFTMCFYFIYFLVLEIVKNIILYSTKILKISKQKFKKHWAKTITLKHEMSKDFLRLYSRFNVQYIVRVYTFYSVSDGFW